jgi:hypothetical protein
MKDFGVLTNRQRAVIALIHSIVFLGIASHGFVSPKAGVLHRSGATGDFILIAIYLVVVSILMWLVSISRGLVERAYFTLCAISASSGLLRTLCGDCAVSPSPISAGPDAQCSRRPRHRDRSCSFATCQCGAHHKQDRP